MGKEVPQRHGWGSRDTVQWPVNWPKELKEDPFKERKEVIHQEINRKVQNARRRRQKLEESFPAHTHASPRQDGLTMNTVFRTHCLPGALRTAILAHKGSWDQP